jgi:hypothetical protein
MIKVFLFGFKYFFSSRLPNIKSTWNEFKQKILDNSNYDNFHCGGDFLHACVIMNKYFGKIPKMKKMNT